jgi:hypothetical protein
MRHIIPISGKDSLAAAIVQMTFEPDLPYEFIYNDTKAELPETYQWLDLVEKILGIKITRIGKSLESVIAEQGILPSANARYCTRLSKIFPMNDWIGKEDSTIYIGLRHDEERAGLKPEKNQSVRYPLKEKQIGLSAVYEICKSKNLMPPKFFWERLFKKVVEILQCDESVVRRELKAEMIFDRAFAWRSRPNCFFCFYQRRYEWIGLLEFHPELFQKAEEIENQFAGDKREKAFYWIQDLTLSKLKLKSNYYFQKRAMDTARMIHEKLQGDLFAHTIIDEMDLAQKSCGLFCGK